MTYQPTVNDTWNIKELYENDAAWQADLDKAVLLAEEMGTLEGSLLENSSQLLKGLKLSDELGMLIERVLVFSKMNFDQDMSDINAKTLYEKSMAALNIVNEKVAFFTPELMNLSSSKWQDFKAQEESLELYDFLINNILEEKDHILTKSEEIILGKLASVGGSFSNIYDDLTVNDMVYPTITTPEGEKIVADNANYMIALTHNDRSFRKKYFESLLNTYGAYENTITSNYYGSVKNDVYAAKLRNFDSALDSALFSDRVPLSVYENLLTSVEKNNAPLIDYLNYRKEKLKLDRVHFYDLFVPLSEDTAYKYTFDDAKELVLSATKVLGDDYVNILNKAFNDRWIDRYPRKNKDNGAYAIHTYGHHPYSLMNFTGTLNDVFTIAHELGHAMHSYFSMQNQPYVYADYSIFTAEVASTVNEELLFNYLIKNSNDKKEQEFLLSNELDGLRSTLYRQTMFADFEWQAHQLVEKDLPLTPDVLKEIYHRVYKKYHGDALEIDDALLYEWLRIPHFYRAYYVYQYATGIASAIAISQKIIQGEKNAVANYRKFLTTGGSNHPIELLKIAGVDIASPEPIVTATQYFSSILNNLKKL